MPTSLASQILRQLASIGASILLPALTPASAAPADSASSDLAARVEAARATHPSDARLDALGTVARGLAIEEIPAVLRIAERLPSLRERMALSDTAVRRWGDLAPADAFMHVAALPEGYSKAETIRSVAAAFAQKDAAAAARAAMHMKPGRARIEALQAVGETWARIEVAAALQWANGIAEGGAKEAVLRKIYFVWVHTDPVSASATMHALPASEIRKPLLINVAANWARIDPAAALQWARTLPAGEERDLAQIMAIESWADSDPRAAAQFSRESLPPSLRPRAALAALDRWATQDPRAAFFWVSRSGDRLLTEQGIPQVLNTCASVCPIEAAQWVEQLPIGPIRDHAIAAFVEAAHTWDVATAAQLSLKISEPALREQRAGQCLRLWLEWDPTSARDWLAQTDFPEQTIQRWLSAARASVP